MSDDKTKETHPSYGMVSLSRVSGAGHLFGSPLSQHFGTMRLRINHGYRVHENGEDKYRSSKEVVEIELSASQFAEMITCTNMSEGVPCTFRWLGGMMPEVPHTESTEMHRALDSFKAQVAGIVANVKARGEKIATIVQKGKLTKDDQANINNLVNYVVMEVATNAPFFVELFQEVTDKVATKAKAEVAAMFEHAIRAAGMEHIASLRQAPIAQVAELPAHEANDDSE